MKKILLTIGNFLASPFVACANYTERSHEKALQRRESQELDNIEKSYNIEFRNGTIWITHEGVCVIPCDNGWTLDELKFELNRIIINSKNSFLNNGQNLV